MTTETKIKRHALGMETWRLVRASLQKHGRTEGKTLTFTELEREAILLAHVIACGSIEKQFENLVAKRSNAIEAALLSFAAELGKANKRLIRRIEALEKAAQK